MTINPFDGFTDKQYQIIKNRRLMAFERLEEAYKNAFEAHQAIVTLPCVNERGESVVVGCNNVMCNVRDSWRVIARQWEKLCEVIDLVRTRELCDQYGGPSVCGGIGF